MVQVFVGGDVDGTVDLEVGQTTATGTLNATLLDPFEGIFFDPLEVDWEITTDPSFGLASLDGAISGIFTGTSVDWTFVVDEDDPDVEDLKLGDAPLIDTFVITATPTDTTYGPATQTVTIEIFGVCFVTGTLIETENGLVPVEQLEIGQQVMTRDAGLQPIVWLGGGPCPEEEWRQDDRHLPVCIRADALGPGCPARDLYVSQNHRILVSGARAELFFGEAEVLVAAKHLCALPGISIVEPTGVLGYHHILCGEHHIVTANGCEAESMLLGDEALVTLSPDDLLALEEILQETALCEDEMSRASLACRRILSRVEAVLMLEANAYTLEAVAA
ncbi:MAG: Hint domain-containing protein [Pseudomonadota bacterium]